MHINERGMWLSAMARWYSPGVEQQQQEPVDSHTSSSAPRGILRLTLCLLTAVLRPFSTANYNKRVH